MPLKNQRYFNCNKKSFTKVSLPKIDYRTENSCYCFHSFSLLLLPPVVVPKVMSVVVSVVVLFGAGDGFRCWEVGIGGSGGVTIKRIYGSKKAFKWINHQVCVSLKTLIYLKNNVLCILIANCWKLNVHYLNKAIRGFRNPTTTAVSPLKHTRVGWVYKRRCQGL